MDNLQRLAYPQPIAIDANFNTQTAWDIHPDFAGFTKLELAALMIAQGYVSDRNNLLQGTSNYQSIGEYSVSLAKAVLEEANK